MAWYMLLYYRYSPDDHPYYHEHRFTNHRNFLYLHVNMFMECGLNFSWSNCFSSVISLLYLNFGRIEAITGIHRMLDPSAPTCNRGHGNSSPADSPLKKRNVKDLQKFPGIYSMRKCHYCTPVINQSYWFEILPTIIKSFKDWGQVIISLWLVLTSVLSVSISSVY